MKKLHNTKHYFFITISFLALAIFFIIISLIKYAPTDNLDNNQTVTSIVGDPLITPAVEVYKSFVRHYNPTWGSGDLTIIVFADLTDEKSKTLWQDLKKIRQDDRMRAQITLVWKSFPLATHSLAQSAANAALCANQQNEFWQFSDLLFENQENLSEEKFLDLAQELNLNLEEFETCFNSGKNLELIGQDMEDAGKLLIDGIPYMFVGARRIGADEIDHLRKIVEEEIEN